MITGGGHHRDHGPAAESADSRPPAPGLTRENGVIEHRRRIGPVFLVLGLPAAGGRARRAGRERERGRPREQAASEAHPAAAPAFLPPPSTTRHGRGSAAAGRLRATAGTLPVGRIARGRTRSVPRRLLRRAGGARRGRSPSCFNGGPGAASAFLQLGGLGPRAVAFADDGGLPAATRAARSTTPTPGCLHRPRLRRPGRDRLQPQRAGSGEATSGRFFGSAPDAAALAAFIRLWLAAAGADALADVPGRRELRRLSRRGARRGSGRAGGIQVSGAVLISPVLEFACTTATTTLLPWVLRVPSFAAVARTHGKTASRAAGLPDLDAFLDQAEDFSLLELLPGLAQGDALPASATDTLYRRLANLVGLSTEVVRRHAGRIPREVFAKELLRTQRRVISLYDGSITASTRSRPGPVAAGREADPAHRGARHGDQWIPARSTRVRDRRALSRAEPGGEPALGVAQRRPRVHRRRR